jgi:hypothetical protein
MGEGCCGYSTCASYHRYIHHFASFGMSSKIDGVMCVSVVEKSGAARDGDHSRRLRSSRLIQYSISCA